MEPVTPHSNEKNRLASLYLLIGGLMGVIVFQFFYFSHKVNSAKQLPDTGIHSAGAPASSFARSASRHPRLTQNTSAAVPGSLPAMDDFLSDDPFEALDRIHSRLNNMMNTARTYAPIVMQQMNRDLSSDFIPAVDMEETDTSYMVRADIPGLEKDKINITVQNGVLVIQGIRETQTQQSDPSGIYTSERSYGSFARTVALPGPVNEAAIKADYKNGVLTVEIPKEKNEQAATKRIPVQ